MITMSQLVTELYPLLNTDAMQELLTGGVYREVRPDDSQLNDLVIHSQTLNNSRISEIYLMVNGYVRDLPNGIPDEATLASIEEAVIEIFEELDLNGYSVEITNVTRFPDRDRPGWWYTSIRLLFHVYNENFNS